MAVLNLKPRQTKEIPLIEIMGPIDVGKTVVAQLVARRLQATLLTFPILDPYTMTGRALLASLTNSPKGLESNSQWWFHIYAANLYEQQQKIKTALESGPVVVTNYIFAYRIWAKAMGLDISSFTVGLPDPDIAYLLSGNEVVPTDRPKFDFSPEFVSRIRRGIMHPADSRIYKVNLQEVHSKFYHMTINNAACTITDHVQEKFDCSVMEDALFTQDCFLRKKDLK